MATSRPGTPHIDLLAIYILQQPSRPATLRHRGKGKLGTMAAVCMAGQVISPDVQPVALAKWHAFSLTNQQRLLIPKPLVILTNTHVHFGQLLLVKVHNLFTPQTEVHASVRVQFTFFGNCEKYIPEVVFAEELQLFMKVSFLIPAFNEHKQLVSSCGFIFINHSTKIK